MYALDNSLSNAGGSATPATRCLDWQLLDPLRCGRRAGRSGEGIGFLLTSWPPAKNSRAFVVTRLLLEAATALEIHYVARSPLADNAAVLIRSERVLGTHPVDCGYVRDCGRFWYRTGACRPRRGSICRREHQAQPSPGRRRSAAGSGNRVSIKRTRRSAAGSWTTTTHQDIRSSNRSSPPISG